MAHQRTQTGQYTLEQGSQPRTIQSYILMPGSPVTKGKE